MNRTLGFHVLAQAVESPCFYSLFVCAFIGPGLDLKLGVVSRGDRVDGSPCIDLRLPCSKHVGVSSRGRDDVNIEMCWTNTCLPPQAE